MNLQVIYCNHQTAPLEVREKLAFSSDEQLQRAYDIWLKSFPDSEMVVLSTCNRIELYTAQENRQHIPTQQDLANFLSEFHQVPLPEFFSDLLEVSGPEAVRHLFHVACSLDSMVLGEPQIVNQVKQAYQLAQQNQACGPITHAMFQQAIAVSAKVRTQTRLAEGRVSIASVAVGEFGKSIFDHFGDKTVLIIGAGEMAEETLRYLKDEGVNDIVVVNRSREKAENLANEWGGRTHPIENLDECMAHADVIVSTTGASLPVVDVERFRRVRQQSNHPVFILDLGAPRDFAPGVADLDENVFLYDIDDLEQTCQKNRQLRVKEIEKAKLIIEQETERFMHDIYHRATGPIIKRLRDDWNAITQEELQRLFNKMEHLNEPDRQNIRYTMDRIVNKLLHPPLETLKQEARQGTPHTLLDAIKHLFIREP